jgi:hypothetical protein
VFEALIFRKAAVASLCCASWVKLYYLAGLADALSQIIIIFDVCSLISEIYDTLLRKGWYSSKLY